MTVPIEGISKDAKASGRFWRLPTKFRFMQSRLEATNSGQADTAMAVQRLHVKAWFLSRGKIPPAVPLHPSVVQLVLEWFNAVDEDGSKELDRDELRAALQAARIPCNEDTINEFLSLIDVNQDGTISWEEFHTFMADEFNNGKNLLDGEYMLPSGTTLNFGVMIGKLKRDKLMKEVLESGDARQSWADIAGDPAKLHEQMDMIEHASKLSSSVKDVLGSQKTTAYSASDATQKTPRSKAATALLSTIDREEHVRQRLQQRLNHLPLRLAEDYTGARSTSSLAGGLLSMDSFALSSKTTLAKGRTSPHSMFGSNMLPYSGSENSSSMLSHQASGVSSKLPAQASITSIACDSMQQAAPQERDAASLSPSPTAAAAASGAGLHLQYRHSESTASLLTNCGHNAAATGCSQHWDPTSAQLPHGEEHHLQAAVTANLSQSSMTCPGRLTNEYSHMSSSEGGNNSSSCCSAMGPTAFLQTFVQPLLPPSAAVAQYLQLTKSQSGFGCSLHAEPSVLSRTCSHHTRISLPPLRMPQRSHTSMGPTSPAEHASPLAAIAARPYDLFFYHRRQPPPPRCYSSLGCCTCPWPSLHCVDDGNGQAGHNQAATAGCEAAGNLLPALSVPQNSGKLPCCSGSGSNSNSSCAASDMALVKPCLPLAYGALLATKQPTLMEVTGPDR